MKTTALRVRADHVIALHTVSVPLKTAPPKNVIGEPRRVAAANSAIGPRHLGNDGSRR